MNDQLKNIVTSISSNNYIKIFNQSISSSKQADQIQNLLKNQDNQFHQKQKRLKQIFKKNSLDYFFINLQNHINYNHILSLKKSQRLIDGIYILLTGCVIGFFMEERQKISAGQKENRQHLFSQLKSGNYNHTFNNQTKGDYPFIKGKTDIGNKFTMIGFKAFDVLQCIDRNFITTQDCTFIQINSFIQSQTKFQRLKRLRSQTLRSNFLPFNNSKSIFNLNLNKENSLPIIQQNKQPFIPIVPEIHQNINIKKYYFRNPIKVQKFGIIFHGTVKLCKSKSSKEKKNDCSPQIQLINQNGILLSKCFYQAISQNVQIFQFKNINILTQQSLKILNKISETKNKTKFCIPRLPIKKIDSQHSKSQKNIIALGNLNSSLDSKQSKKRHKQLINISKNYEKYSIISMYTCQRSINFSKQILANAKTKLENIYDPLVLFDLQSHQTKKVCLPLNNRRPLKSQKLKKQVLLRKTRTVYRSPTLIERLNKRSFKTCSSWFYNKQSLQNIQKEEAKSMYLKQSKINLPQSIKKSQQKDDYNFSKLYKHRINKRKQRQNLSLIKPAALVSFSPNYDTDKLIK